jgi:hypothetical protein
MGVSGQRHAPDALYPRERTPGTHCIGGWVGPTAGLDARAKEKSSGPVGDRTPIVQPVVRHYTACATAAHRFPTDLRIIHIIKYTCDCNSIPISDYEPFNILHTRFIPLKVS